MVGGYVTSKKVRSCLRLVFEQKKCVVAYKNVFF